MLPSEFSWSRWYLAAREDMAFRYGIRHVPKDAYKEEFALGRTPTQAAKRIYDNMVARADRLLER